MVIDPDRATRAATAEMLVDLFYRPLIVGNGHEALERLRRGLRPRAMLIDLHLPFAGAVNFCDGCDDELQFAFVPRILMSVDATHDSCIERCGAIAVLRKPIVAGELLMSLDLANKMLLALNLLKSESEGRSAPV